MTEDSRLEADVADVAVEADDVAESKPAKPLPIIPCTHWRECGVKNGGCCKIGAYERPSYGTCLSHCKQYDGPERTPVLVKAIADTMSGCKGCGSNAVPIVIERWLGLLWYGKPWPKRRLRFQSPFRAPFRDVSGEPGCGCIVFLKAMTSSISALFRVWGAQVRRARAVANAADEFNAMQNEKKPDDEAPGE